MTEPRNAARRATSPAGQTFKSPATVDSHERPRRDFLTPAEVEKLLRAARQGRFGARDYAMLLLAYRHGLRVSELVGIGRRDVSLEEGRIWVTRKKNGLSTSQPLAGDELRALKAYGSKRRDGLPWLFLSSQGGQMTRQNFHHLVRECGTRAELGLVYPHMLRHSCENLAWPGGIAARPTKPLLIADPR